MQRSLAGDCAIHRENIRDQQKCDDPVEDEHPQQRERCPGVLPRPLPDQGHRENESPLQQGRQQHEQKPDQKGHKGVSSMRILAAV